MASDADEGGGLSGDEGFDEDIEALSRACFLTGTDPRSLRHPSSAAAAPAESEDEDDFELVRGIRQRFNACCSEAGEEAPLTLKPLNVLLPPTEDDVDDEEDDFAILQRIQKRFSCYDQHADGLKNNREKPEQVRSKGTFPEKGTSKSVELDIKNAPNAVPEFSDMHNTSDTPETLDTATPDTFPSCLTEAQETDTDDLAMVPTEGCGFPKAAQMFVEAIRKNRACQKFIRNKMMQTEARIEENKKLQHRVKLLRGFQIKCKKQTTRELSRQQDARVQLISVAKPKGKSKANGKKDSALCHGPAENSHVACYKMVLAEYRMSLSRRKWTDEERENLAKGIKQQFQELLLQRSVDSISEMVGDSDDVDSIYASIRDRDITSEDMRLFLPKVNWEQLATMYVKGRSAAECEARWLNWEDPLINHKPWTNSEDKKLLHIVQQRGISNWIEIAVLLETNRTPFQCLARYQRSLNASVMRSEWSKDEDEKLRAAVAALGESNWENVAATLVGRTGPQCSNRWIKSLNPAREKTGKWSSDEDKRMKVAVVFFGPKNWKKVAQFVPGRTHVQCRERWANNLDPSLNLGEWTEEEDIKLKAAIVEHGYCWSKVAACVSSRTDNQCTRRWKALFPHEVPLLQAARKIQKVALISNFVDRESERPTLGPKDFIPLQLTNAVSESGELNQSGKRRTKPRSKKATKEAQICTEEILSTNSVDVEKIAGQKTNSNKRPIQRRRKNKEVSEATNVEKVAGEKTNSKKELIRRRHKNKEASEAIEDATVGQEIVPLDGETEKKKNPRKRKIASRSNKATKAAQVCTDEILLTNSADIENVDGEKSNSKKKSMLRRRKKNKEASAAIEDARFGQETLPLGSETKKKRTPRKRKMASREGPKEKDGAATFRVDTLPDVEQATEPRRKKIRSCPTNSRVSTCGDSEVLTMNNLEEAGEYIGDGARTKNKRSSVLGQEKNEQCKRFNEAASSFGENEAFSEGRRFSSPHLEHDDWHADPNEVNSSPCPNSMSLRITNANEARAFAHDGKRRKDSVKSRSSRIKCSALLREVSDITEISDSETLGSIVLKKREMRRSLKKQSGLICSSQKSGSVINKKVNAVDEGEFLEISRAGGNIDHSARNHSCSRGKRKGCIPQARKSENAEMGNKFSTVDGTHRGKSLKKSNINDQLGMTLTSFIKKGQKKRKLNLAPKTPPLDEFSNDARIGWL